MLIYLTKTLTKLLALDSAADECVDKRNLTSYELERLEREEEFDERIARLKQEMSAQARIIHRSTTADELHPLVHNLPHNIIQTTHDNLPDVEISY